MMLSHPVILGFLWSLLLQSLSGQPEISNKESNKVYAYSYHFQHNGTTNSKEILRSVLGGDPEFGIDPPDGKAIVKTFSSPNIRGFFTKGVLPAGPLNPSYNTGFNSPFNTNSALDGIKRVVESNLQPPNRDIITGLLPPISPDIAKEFPGDFNNANHLGLNFQNQEDFPKIPPPPAPQINNNNHGVSRVQNFAHDTPDGGKVVGKIETFAYNPPPVINSISRSQENSQGFRRNENILNNNQEVTGHRTQSYFRQEFRTVTPNLETNFNANNNHNQNSGIENRNGPNNNNNQWWNVINVLGDGNNNKVNNPNPEEFSRQVQNNVKQVEKKLMADINRQFGARLSAFRQSFQNDLHPNNRQGVFPNNNAHNNQIGIHNNQNNFNNNQNNMHRNQNNIHNNQNRNLNNNLGDNLAYRNQPNSNTVFNNRQTTNYGPQNPINNNNAYPNPQSPNNAFNNNNQNFNNYNNNQNVNNYNNQDTERKVMNLIQNVNTHLNNLHGNTGARVNNVGLTWDDDPAQNFNDWSSRQPHSNGRPFSNAHSGPLNSPPVIPPVEPVDILKTTLEALVGGRNFQIPSISGDQGGNYRNVGGGGVEKFFGSDRVVEGPNAYSRNQQRGYERNFQVNSNTGYQRSNQWSTNTLRRLDAQSSKPDFSKDFIDVFRDDY